MIWNTLRLAFREIRRNVLRSLLTILGIVIGVAAVIVMVTLGAGTTAQVTEQIASMGSNLLMLMPGPRHGGRSAGSRYFDLADTQAIAREIPAIAAVAPVSNLRVTAVYGNQNWSTTVTGTDNAFFEVRNWSIARGEPFDPRDLRAGRAVCLLGETVRKELFGAQDPLGATVRLKTLSCKVIGILNAKGQSTFGSDADDLMVIPLRTFQRRLAGNQHIGQIHVSAREGEATEKVKQELEALMRVRRNIPPKGDDDFRVMDMQEIVSTLTGVTTVLTTLLGSVAAISLLVGGIGIMNIMLVSVTERTREIGIRMAIGALERDVLLQFLVEAVVLSSFGGLFGIALALAASAALAALMHIPFIFNPGIVLIAFLFSATVGIVFGYFPARRAARLDPIEALRHE